MKSVLAIGLIMLGFIVLYSAVSGQLPSTNSVSVAGSSSTGASTTSGGGAVMPTPTQLGLPTMQHLHDVNASLGGMQ